VQSVKTNFFYAAQFGCGFVRVRDVKKAITTVREALEAKHTSKSQRTDGSKGEAIGHSHQKEIKLLNSALEALPKFAVIWANG